ncbi:RICIN domain-containing protein [Arsenicibacter rosenii]|uniref:Ricin B lectin domain-containing protein n=1 Tax=Arsenicibacter rosenii TaxID=1750698 RepID=A0A1S2VAR4_9BACT|nr:RICIN domain-containing protein [Arsenicibacter rosenii]OIN55793.1 hypothetical protein BLX24_28130 [Arsenicibacter rosenii]
MRTFIISLVCCSLAMLVSGFNDPKPAEAHQIQNKATGLLLRPYNASKQDNAPVVVYDQYRWKCLTWDLMPTTAADVFQLRNYFSDKTIQSPADAKDGDAVSQQTIQQNLSTQTWKFVKVSGEYYRIQPAGTDLVLTVSGDQTNANVILRKWVSSDHQLWKLLPKPERFDG